MDNSKSASDKVAGTVTDKAGSMFQSAKESVIGAGEQVKTKAGEATEAVKKATGMNK
ncbi:hypothetical protein BVRB_2g025380 [Beta vulgaris subsp. vulgaris]|nr:hypothetical protein BVRB_2g025380 [Beta vulgaris subsp. vulgaris]